MTLADTVRSNVDQRTLNTFWWLDITTTDWERSRKFYGRLFDWTFDDMDGDFHYANAYRGGNRVAGFSDFVQEGQPIQWCAYILVEDAVATCARAKEFGANIVLDAMQVGEYGSMAILADPNGAVFGLWQAGTHQGAELANVEGALTWNELRAHGSQTAAAITFYEQLFGWSAVKADFPGMEYWTFEIDGRVHAGMHLVEDDVPTHWGITIGVENTDAAIEWVTSQGGAVTFGPNDSAFGRVAGIRDPDGAFLNIMQPPPGGWEQ